MVFLLASVFSWSSVPRMLMQSYVSTIIHHLNYNPVMYTSIQSNNLVMSLWLHDFSVVVELLSSNSVQSIKSD
jgi:hypothetical protein